MCVCGFARRPVYLHCRAVITSVWLGPHLPKTVRTYIHSCYAMPDEVESNGGEVSDAMSENDLEYDDNDDKMPDNALKQEPGPDGEVKKKYDPKDPMRPRRKKARRACFACQRAHLTCGMSDLLKINFFRLILLFPNAPGPSVDEH